MKRRELTMIFRFKGLRCHKSLLLISNSGDGYRQKMEGIHKGCGGLGYSHILKK